MVALQASDLTVDHAPSISSRLTTRVALARPRTLWTLAVTSALLLAGYLALFSRGWQVDFLVYREGGQHVLGSGLYSSILTAGSRHLPFTYPPLAALLFWPFSLLSSQAGKLIWDAINVAILTGVIAISIAAAHGRTLVRSDWRTALILVFPAGLLLFPVKNDLQLGQINLLLVLMVVADLAVGVSWRGKRLPQGMLTGLAAGLKLTPLIFAPYLLVTRQWRAARNMMVTFAAATGTMFIVAPGASWLYFTKDAYEAKRVGQELIIINQTLRATILRAHLSPSRALLDLVTVLAACGGIALAALAYRRSSAFLGVLLCAATGLLVSPISWNHHYVWIVPALIWLLAGTDRPVKGLEWAAVAALVFMISPPFPPSHTNFVWYLRENAYVVATLTFLASIGAMLWVRSRTREALTRGAPTH
jgi:alpha-1,2-mannosyltransferase